MAIPNVPLTSPYAPGPNHMNDVFRIADMIRNTGTIQAQGRGASRLAVADLIGGVGETAAGIFQQRDARRVATQKQQVITQLAERYARGEKIDPMETLRALGGDVEAAKQVIELAESFKPKKETLTEHNPLYEQRDATGKLVTPATPAPPDPEKVARIEAEKVEAAARETAIAAIQAAGGDPAKERAAMQAYFAATGKGPPSGILTPPTPKPNLTNVTVPGGPTGAMTQGFTDEQLAAGVPTYRPPTGGGGSTEQDWVLRDGATTPIPIPRGTARPGDVPYTRSMAQRNVTAGDAEELAGLDTSLDDVAVLRDTVAPLDPATGQPRPGGSGFTEWAKTYTPGFITEVTGVGAEAKAKQAVIARVKQVIGKTLEGGVLRKEDEIKYKDILPLIEDPPSVVRSKLNGLEAAIKKQKQRRLDALADADYDVSRFQARSDKAARVAPPTTVPDGVRRALAQERLPGVYVMQDGSQWRKNTDGSISPVGP